MEKYLGSIKSYDRRLRLYWLPDGRIVGRMALFRDSEAPTDVGIVKTFEEAVNVAFERWAGKDWDFRPSLEAAEARNSC